MAYNSWVVISYNRVYRALNGKLTVFAPTPAA
jgi:hypothetical protein